MNIYLKKKNIIDPIENHLPTTRTLESSSRQKLLEALATVCLSFLASIQEWPDPWPSSTTGGFGLGKGLCPARAFLCSPLTPLHPKNLKDVPCCWAVSFTPWR